MGLNDMMQKIMPEGYMVIKTAMVTEVYDSETGERKLVTSHSDTTTMWDAIGMMELAGHDIKAKYASMMDRPLGEENEDGDL